MKYVKINEDKVPQHSLDTTYTLEQIKNEPNVAVLIEEPYVVVDVDNSDHALALYDALTTLGVKCAIMQTTKGTHFWFKTSTPIINVIGANTPITLKVDIKSWGKKSLATVKLNNEWRLWLVSFDDIDYVDEIPFWLKPISYKKDLFGLKEGEGRDGELFSYIIPLLKLKFSKKQIYTIFNIINKFVFLQPLTQKEIDKMFDGNDIFNETLAFFDKKQFLHHDFAKWLKETHKIQYYNGKLYLYDNGLYVPKVQKIESLMIEKIPQLTSHQRIESIKYLELLGISEPISINNNKINVYNGLIDIETEKIEEHNENIFSINQLPVFYNPGIYDADVDKFLDDISNNDKQIRTLLEELIGYTLLPDCRFQKAFILVGQGANGKSAFLKMLSDFLGKENVSALPLEELNQRFKTAELVDKVANIGDDISAELLSDSSTFKKLVSGDTISVERKNKDPFDFSNSAKLIFSANQLPPVSDKSYGLKRRLVIIPFLNTFSPDKTGYDPNIKSKLNTSMAKSYLLNLGIKAIKRVMETNSFTSSDKVIDMLEQYEVDNNNLLQWLLEKPVIVDVDIKEIYREYCFYCHKYNTIPYKITKFTNELQNKYPYLELVNTTRNGSFTRIFKEKKRFR